MILFGEGFQNRVRAGVLCFGMIFWLVSPVNAQNSEEKCFKRNYTFNVLAENDLWGSGSDKHFTHGTRLSFVESKENIEDAPACTPEQREKESGGLDFLRNMVDPLLGEKSSLKTNQVSFIIGQNIFTPEDISNPNLIPNDRPYAGWLYFGVGLIRSQIKKEGYAIFDTFELDLGIVGPESFAEDAQKWVHQNVSDSPIPRGWDHQLKNEPGILVNLERKWRMELTPHGYQGLQVDFLPSVGAALGNVYTYGSLGTMFRLGVNLPVDYGPPRIRPGAQGSDFFQYDKKKPFSWYAYAGVEGRALAVNIFLDGNTFAESHSVDKKIFVGDFHAGFVLVMYRVRVAFSQVFRSSEFNGQKEMSEFGSINLSVAW
jgi:hypothetical protein